MSQPLKLYAGLDVDMQAKLYFVIGGVNCHVSHADWIRILDELKAQPGEMLVVTLSREKDAEA